MDSVKLDVTHAELFEIEMGLRHRKEFYEDVLKRTADHDAIERRLEIVNELLKSIVNRSLKG